MPLNPIVYTEKIVRSFLKYQLSAYPLADPVLNQQMRDQLSLDSVRHTPLLQGPYFSLSKAFLEGAKVSQLVDEKILHPHLLNLIPPSVQFVYGHQEEAIRAIHDKKPTLVSTGTGSGKTECFLYPIISHCLNLRDQNAPPGISAVLVYPMNALAEDQLDRLRSLLAGSNIPFAMYVGKTPETELLVHGHRLAPNSSNADYLATLEKFRAEGRSDSVHPAEEICSREMMRTPGKQPRILLTNVKQLELLLTRHQDVELFADALLDFLVFDEAHTFTGIQGAETACLIRRLRTFCGKSSSHTTCIATSATIVDQNQPNAARNFASRFFGVPSNTVVTVNEKYQKESWSKSHVPNPPNVAKLPELLKRTLAGLESNDVHSAAKETYQALTGQSLAIPSNQPDAWQAALYDALQSNQIAANIATTLHQPRKLSALMSDLEVTSGRRVTEEEMLIYLALGAIAVKNNRPLMRPVAHAFIRGISGGVVSFPSGNAPKLWLSSAEEIAKQQDNAKIWRPRLFTCTTCGQHYFLSFLKDFDFSGNEPQGGQLNEKGSKFWEALDESNGGNRVVLIDKLVSQDDEQTDSLPRTAGVSFCRHCGTAHPIGSHLCCGCGSAAEQVRLYAVRTSDKQPGYLSSCLSCGARGKSLGRRFREPMRELRATHVSDVHVLAQDMIQHADRKRLLLFTDNRQDAAFQAGWMKDHARRFRLRNLMADAIHGREVSVGEIATHVSEALDANDTLSRLLIPEVWRYQLKEGSGGLHADERLYFMRIQVLREITLASNQQIGLEPWGRIKVRYDKLSASAPVIQQWAKRLKIPPDDLEAGVASLLDLLRRRQMIYDPLAGIYSKYWHEGEKEIQRGYMPMPQGLQGMKLQRTVDDKPELVFQWHGSRNGLVTSIAKKWGVAPDDVEPFLKDLWNHLIDPAIGILVPVLLKGSKGTPVANCAGTYQLDATKVRISANTGYYQCNQCRRKSSRRPPMDRCMAWQCNGTLVYREEDPDNYNLQLLDQRYAMLNPEEHTAMVPQEHRERIENWFKGSGDQVNVLVCTPTLELGVDIGQLDSVLLRNVPPLPANYWQRAGRAGRRNRMAVNVTYCRTTSHDRSYYNDPLRMLAGRVDPPAFNMRNDLLISKHVHAAIITRLSQLAYGKSHLIENIAQQERDHIARTLELSFPNRLKTYLFESDGGLRNSPYNLDPFTALIQRYRDSLLAYVREIFQQGWPASDEDATRDKVLAQHVDAMPVELEKVIRRLRKRLLWAIKEIQRLNARREQLGTLDPEEDVYFRRCDQTVKRLKGIARTRRSSAQGIDDNNTFNLLASEGFLPGYGLDTGTVIGFADVPPGIFGAVDFSLPRPTAMAVREYVPGNLIYANGQRFVARRFHHELDEDRSERPFYEVNIDRQALSVLPLTAITGSMTSKTIKALPVCDVDLIHASQITDEEENRFQMAVAAYGIEQGKHNGGMHYDWGGQVVSLRQGVHFRIVNVGASAMIDRSDPELGYPVCEICGYSVSPLSSTAQIMQFRNSHEERCGKKPNNIGFYADVVADALRLHDLPDSTAAYSVLEALRMAASQVLDMHIEDLQLLVVGSVDRDEVQATLWDPMPGGSGLLQQCIQHFSEIAPIALEIVSQCPSDCMSSCNDCLQTFRNSFYHKHLDRHQARAFIEKHGSQMIVSHTIPATQASVVAATTPQGAPVNQAEDRLKHLLVAAGFTDGEFQQQIRFRCKVDLGHQIGSTTPDVFFEGDPEDPEDRGVCIYLDGMSEHIHGNPQTAAADREIRDWLRNNGYQVITITYVELSDANAMRAAFRKLAKYLSGREMADRIANDMSWYL